MSIVTLKIISSAFIAELHIPPVRALWFDQLVWSLGEMEKKYAVLYSRDMHARTLHGRQSWGGGGGGGAPQFLGGGGEEYLIIPPLFDMFGDILFSCLSKSLMQRMLFIKNCDWKEYI